MEGIRFGDYHSYDDFGLIIVSKTIGTPKPKTYTFDISGVDGELDVTEYLGKVKYGNRPLSFEFEIIKKQKDYVTLFSEIQNAIHGKRLKIILDIDEDYYYLGRVTVNEWKSDVAIGKVVIDVDADPYKNKINITNFSATVDDSGVLIANLLNLKKPVTPMIRVSGETRIKYETGTRKINRVISAGTWTIYDLLLEEGNNIVTFEAKEGNTILISYQEGCL